MPDQPHTLRKAATVMLLRERDQGMQTLMLKRSKALAFGPSAWVFPGGAIDEADYQKGGDEASALRRAAIRETREEAGLEVSSEELTYFLRITTPTGRKRFETHFFATLIDGNDTITIDESEIVEHRWMSPNDAIIAYEQREMMMMPPTVMTLMRMSLHDTAAAGLADLQSLKPILLEQSIARKGDTMLTMYRGDSGFESGDPDLGEPHHRNVFPKGRDGKWLYVHTVDPDEYPMLDGGYSKLKR